MLNRARQALTLTPNGQFVADIWRLIWAYKWYSLAIFLLTILQEVSALWPVNLLGQFVDRLQTGELGAVVWLLMGASIFAGGVARGNIILRHKMFYETDFRKRVELTLQTAKSEDIETAGAANTLVANAVSGITNAVYYVLGNFTPVIIKIIVVSGSLLAYNRAIGWAFLGSLLLPSWLTVAFNKWLRVLRDAQYAIVSRAEGAGTKIITAQDRAAAEAKFIQIMGERKNILIALLAKHQTSLYVREVALIGCQFLVVFMALAMRERLGITPGDFTKIVGYTAQVSAAFINTAACLDAVISYSRAYHVYLQNRR